MSDGEIPNDRQTMFILYPSDGKEGYKMKEYIRIPEIPLYNEMPKPKDKDCFIFGSKKAKIDHSDTFPLAIKRYTEGYDISIEQAAAVTGIAASSLYNYIADYREVTYSVMCAVCIGLRLHPDRQRHLFHLCHVERPDRDYCTDPRDLIIVDYLDECAFDRAFSLIACNDAIININRKPLSSLSSDKEGSE